jgi:mRNA interferase MazF
VVLSRDGFNHSAAPFVVVVPGTTTERGSPLHTVAEPSETGLRRRTFFQPELLTPVDKAHLDHPVGRLSPVTLRELEIRIMSFLDLD